MGNPVPYTRSVVRLDDGAVDLHYYLPNHGNVLTLRLTPQSPKMPDVARFVPNGSFVGGSNALDFIEVMRAAIRDAEAGCAAARACPACAAIFGVENAMPGVYQVTSILTGESRFLCADHFVERHRVVPNE